MVGLNCVGPTCPKKRCEQRQPHSDVMNLTVRGKGRRRRFEKTWHQRSNEDINPYSAGVALMGRFKNQTQPNVIIDIYF